MTATVSRFNPLLFSERLVTNNQGAFTLCRIAVLAMMYDGSTLGEWTTNPDGTKWGKAKIAMALKRMRDATGQPNADGYGQDDVPGMLDGIKAPDVWDKRIVPWDDLMDDLRRGFSVELAGNVSHTPPDSPLRKYVNPVAHDILLLRVNDNTDQIAFIDPMTPHGTRRYIRTAPKAHFQAFGSEFRTDGNYTAGRVKKGKYTQEAIAKRHTGVIDLEQRIEGLQGRIATLQARAMEDDDDINVLQQYVLELQALPDKVRVVVGDLEVAAAELRDLL